MQSLAIHEINILPFTDPLIRPFVFAGNTVSQRTGFYLQVKTVDGIIAEGEIAPLPGISLESLKKAKHDLEEIKGYLNNWQILLDKKSLIVKIRKDERITNCCPSVRFGIESALFQLAAKTNGQSLAQFLEALGPQVRSAVLLQGTHEQIIADAKKFNAQGATVFKLKVGDRNIPLDVKKVQDLRDNIRPDAMIRLDGNRVWSLSEAILFAQLIGNAQIEFIEEPLSDMAKANEFYQAVHMPIALDETLSVIRCGITAPGRCMPTLANLDGVKAFVIKPMVLGGVVAALDWIEEAKSLGKKSIISSSFETHVGLEVLKVLADLSGQPSGLGTQRWMKTDE